VGRERRRERERERERGRGSVYKYLEAMNVINATVSKRDMGHAAFSNEYKKIQLNDLEPLNVRTQPYSQHFLSRGEIYTNHE
jgi:hypothetical protein